MHHSEGLDLGLYCDPQSSVFTSASVLLFLLGWLFCETRGSGDVAKVPEPLASNSKDRLWKSVHGHSVMQLMHFHHLLESAWIVL